MMLMYDYLLVVVDQNGNVVDANARATVASAKGGGLFTFHIHLAYMFTLTIN